MSCRLLAGAAAIAASATIAGCGGSGDAGASPDQGVGPRIGQSIRLFNCEDWRRSDAATRLAVVRQLKGIVGGTVVGGRTGAIGHGNVLEDEQAYDLFEGNCKQPYAHAFVLYKLYARAAAFAGQAP